LLDTPFAKTAGAEAISATAESATIACFIYSSFDEAPPNNGLAIGPFHERLFTYAAWRLLSLMEQGERLRQ
jgi:hypothetical protein